MAEDSMALCSDDRQTAGRNDPPGSRMISQTHPKLHLHHHLKGYAEGGETSALNLCGLCSSCVTL